jgi:hypothetical protein
LAFLDILIGVFTLANTFIALFIVVYAFLFLRKTKSHKDRRPWDYLFLASLIYLVYNLFLIMLQIFGVNSLFYTLDLYELSVFFQFIYTGLILLSFISQTDLIFNNDIIIIMKKENLHAHQAQTVSPKEHIALKNEGAEEAKEERVQEAQEQPKTDLEDVVKTHKVKTVPRFEPKRITSKKGSSRKVSSKKRKR